MNSLSTSTCPVCRSEFDTRVPRRTQGFQLVREIKKDTLTPRKTLLHRLGAPCEALGSQISALYPEEAAARAAEVDKWELETMLVRSPAAQHVAQPVRWACHCCGTAPVPLVANCGHLLCDRCAARPACDCGARRVFAPRASQLIEELAAITPRRQTSRKRTQTASSSSSSEDASSSSPPRPPSESESSEDASALVLPPALVDAHSSEEESGAQQPAHDAAAAATATEYAHFGVGCDACGMCPIRGDAFRCRDCPEAIGFDLCGPCKASDCAPLLGRFAQAHRPDHALEKRVQEDTWLHQLERTNPHLTLNQIIAMIQISAAPPGQDNASESDDARHSDDDDDDDDV